jgi:hypothetical protein
MNQQEEPQESISISEVALYECINKARSRNYA